MANTSASATTTVNWSSIASTSSAAKHQNSRRNASKSHRLPSRQPIYVKLDDEIGTLDCESDSTSLYDSMNEAETDVAKDESDGYLTNADAGFEYEVDELSDSEDIESNDTSSGSDGDVPSQLFAGTTTETQTDSTDLEIFAQDADIEESDGPIGQEFGRANFSICYKCKSEKTNSLYRYCKKCYEIRRTHFPPRPKHRRKRRSSLVRHDSSQLGINSPSTACTSATLNQKREQKLVVDGENDGRTSQNSSCDGQLLPENQQSTSLQKHHSHQHSAGESSCCSSQETLHEDQSFLMAGTSVTSQSTFGPDIDQIFNQIPKRSFSSFFEQNYPSSQESVYPNSATTSLNSSFILETDIGTMTKMDSTASTVSAFTVSGLSQSSIESMSEGKSSILCDSSVTTTATTTMPATATTSDVADTAKNATPSTTSVNRTSSQTVSSTQTSTKRKIDSSNNDGDDGGVGGASSAMMKRTKVDSTNETEDSSLNGMCMICLSKSKNGAFVHNRVLHVCCCYRCAVKVWNKKKRCPICNLPVRNVLQIFVH